MQLKVILVITVNRGKGSTWEFSYRWVLSLFLQLYELGMYFHWGLHKGYNISPLRGKPQSQTGNHTGEGALMLTCTDILF